MNGLHNLNPAFVYNLAFAEYFNETNPSAVNMTRVIVLFKYAAEHGEINALNALAIIYMNGLYNDAAMTWIIKPNVSYSVELLE